MSAHRLTDVIWEAEDQGQGHYITKYGQIYILGFINPPPYLFHDHSVIKNTVCGNV